MIAWMLAAALEVVVPGPAGPLAGTLTLPDGRGPFPAVVIATGSGAHFRDGNRTPDHPYRPFRHIADALGASDTGIFGWGSYGGEGGRRGPRVDRSCEISHPTSGPSPTAPRATR